ncbi:MAG: threonine-phosphate decarboxylase [Chlorobium sp.]|nr:MAG: threonine-phosphate decarboxylase [Chlorobium sp.]
MNTLYRHRHGGVPHNRLTGECRELIDFSVNISPLFPPIGNLSLESFSLQSYPSIDGRGIREFYSARFGLDKAAVLPLNGSIEGIYLLPRALGLRRIVAISPSFFEYERAGRIAGAEMIFLPLAAENSFRLPAIEEIADLLLNADAFLAANPNNPTGTELPPEIILALASRFPDKWFIVDEAFIQFTPAFPHNTLMRKVMALKNVIVLHSLTKFYAIPGLRIGALIAHPDLVLRLLDFKEPWTVNAIAESVAGKLLQCGDYEEKLRVMIFSERVRIAGLLPMIEGIKLAGGAANFFLAQWQRGCSLDALLSYLVKRGIFVRDCRNFSGLEDNYFRFAVRSPEENTALLDALQAASGSLQS